ncbi:hypothetical protein H4219_000321 [Mycoemilia scoparia]|uniref:Neurabin-1/2 PDZ domain-containing protein n=1 Tax=Mycoemilia scoparia TaxID=417184 RepID=A0A9W8A3A9_9FUNG|nr:hypothetical protein H4219_000321 [Mycoemilia scoparia]
MSYLRSLTSQVSLPFPRAHTEKSGKAWIANNACRASSPLQASMAKPVATKPSMESRRPVSARASLSERYISGPFTSLVRIATFGHKRPTATRATSFTEKKVSQQQNITMANCPLALGIHSNHAEATTPKKPKKKVSFSSESAEVIETYSVEEYDRQAPDPWFDMTPLEREQIRKEIRDYTSKDMDLHNCYTSGKHTWCMLCWRSCCSCRILAREMWKRPKLIQ